MATNNHKVFFSRITPLVVIFMLMSSFSPLLANDAHSEGGGGNYPYSGSGDWIIDSDTFVYNETVVVNGNLIIQNGGKLTLRDTTLKMDVSSDGEYYIEVQSGGELHILDWDNDPETRADRCVITDGDDDDDDAAFNTADNHRYTVRVRNGATFVMTNSELREAGFGSGDNAGLSLDGRADFVFEENYIAKCYRGLQLVYSYGKVVRNNTFDACDAQGIIMYYSHDTIIEDNVFQNCPNQGFYLYSNNNADYNLYAARTNIIRNNRFKDNGYGIYVYYRNAYNNTFKGNTLEGNKYGITTTTDAHNNTFIDNTVTDTISYGLFVTTRSKDNIFIDNTVTKTESYGLFITGGSTNNTFTGTTLEQNNYAVLASGRARDNHIIDSTIRYSSNQDIYLYEGTNLTITGTQHEDKILMRAGSYLTDMRYVNVNIKDLRGNRIQGADVSVLSRETDIPGEQDNLAHPRHGTLAYANSEYNWKWMGERVIDGQGEDGSSQEYYWLTKDSPPADTYLTLDLTRPKTFDTVRLLNVRNAGNYDRSTGDFRLGVSNDGTDFDIVHTGALTEDDITTWYEVSLDPTEARYIRFYVDSYYGTGAGLAELEVFNTKDMKKTFDFGIYATDAFGGTDKETDGGGVIKSIPVIYKRYYGADPVQTFVTDVEVSYHGWEDENSSLEVPDETDVNFTKDIITVGPSGKDFTSIQAAIDYANQEKKIMVFPATYPENVVIDGKELSIFTATDDHTDTTVDASSGTGFEVKGGAVVTLDGFVVKNASVGVRTEDTDCIYSNISFTNTTTPFSLAPAVNFTTIDCRFDKDAVAYDDNQGEIFEKNNLVVHVHDRLDTPVEDVRVKVRNTNGELVKNVFTSEEGNTKTMTLHHRTLSQGGETLVSPYTVTIVKGEGTREDVVNMSSARTRSILWHDPSDFGEAISIGDFDGDGVDDYAVGAPGYDGNGNNSGAVFIYKGGDQLILDDLTLDNYDWVIYGERPGDMFGKGLTLGGDLNNDGYNDLVIGAPYTNLTTPNGINAEYYHFDGENEFGELVVEKRDYTIDFNYGNGPPLPGMNNNDFAIKWYGFLNVEMAGDYTFYAYADDGVRFYLNEELLIDEWSYHDTEYSTDPLYLERGLHPFVVEYKETGQGGRIHLRWSSDYFEKQVIPTEAFLYVEERRPGNGGVYIINGREESFLEEDPDDEHRESPYLEELELMSILSSFLDQQFGVVDVGKSLNYLGDLNGDGYDELGLLSSREGYLDQDRLTIYHGTPLTRYHYFKTLISQLPNEDEYRKDFSRLFDPYEWDQSIISDDAHFNSSDEGYLQINTTQRTEEYAYVVSSQGVSSGLDISFMFRRRQGMDLYPVLSIMNYSVPETDVGDAAKQRDATLVSVVDRGQATIRTSPGASAIELSGEDLGNYPYMRILISPEHDNLSIYVNGMLMGAMDISGWDDDLYVVLGDSSSNSNQGVSTLVWLRPTPYSEALNTAGAALSFGAGSVVANGADELIISAYNTTLFQGGEKTIFPSLRNDTLLFGNGNFNATNYENGSLSIAYGVSYIVPNGNFDNGWDNWTKTQNMRDKNDGTWDLTTEERGDWLVYDGPTAGLGPDRDTVASGGGNGRPCDGKLVSESFVVPQGTGFIDLWHHAKWWSFELTSDNYQDDYDDMFIIRVVENGSGDVVDELVYKKPPSDGEEEGRIQLDVSDQGGKTLRLEMEQVNNYAQYDDGVIQIDDVKALTPKMNGTFVSDNITMEEEVTVLIPQWSEVRNEGTVVLKLRTDETEWESVAPVSNGETLHFSEPITRFQYRFELEKKDDLAPPVIRDFEILYFNETNQPLQFNTTGSYRSLLGKITDDDVDELLLSSGTEEKVLVFQGNDIKNAIENHALYFDMSDYLMKFEPDGDDESEMFGERASVITDIDGDGLHDILITDPGMDGDEEDGGVVYAFYSTDVKTDFSLDDVAFDYKGDVEDGALGTEMKQNLVALPYGANPRVELLPFYLVDASISGFCIENNSLIYPATTITLTMTAANIGYGNLGPMDYYMNISSEDGEYTTMFLGKTPGMAADSWEYLNQSWDIPAQEDVLYYINLTLVKAGDQSPDNNQRVVLTTSRYYKTMITPKNAMDSKRPNEYLIYNITISNIGTLGDDQVSLGADVPVGWGYKFRYGGTNITNLTIVEAKDLQFFVRSPMGEPLLDGGYNFTINVTSQNGISSRYLSLKGYLVEVDIVAVRLNFYRRDGVEIGTSKQLVEKERSTVGVELLNMGNLSSGAFNVTLYQDDMLIKTFPVNSLDSKATLELSTELTLAVGDVDFRAVVDEDNALLEYTEVNNEIKRSTTVYDSDPDNDYIVYAAIYNLDQEVVEDAELRVTIEGYSYGFSAETDENGQAQITLTPEDYYEGSKLTIEGIKGSKYTYVADYAYSADGETSVSLMLMKYSLSVQVDKLSKIMYLNDSKTAYLPVDYTITITNSGVENESYELTAARPFGWTFEFIGDIIDKGADKYGLTLGPKSSADVIFRVTNTARMDSPGDKRHHANQGVNLTFSVKPENAPFIVERTTTTIINPEDNLTIKVLNTDGKLYEKNERFYKNLTAGSTSTYTVNLINYGNTYKQFYLINEGENATYATIDETSFAIDCLSAETYRAEFNVDMTVPTFLKEEEEFHLDILLIDESNSYTELVKLSVRVKKLRDVDITFIDETSLGGNNTQLTLELKSKGADELYVAFDSASFVNPAYNGNFTFAPEYLTLAAGATKTLTLTVQQDNMELTIEGGVVELILSLTMDNVSTVQKQVSYEAPRYHKLSLSATTSQKTFYQGESYTYILKLINSGNGPSDIASFVVNDPGGWGSDLQPILIGNGKEKILSFKVTPPSDAANGAYNNITITPYSEDGQAHESLKLVNQIAEKARQLSMSYEEHEADQGYINYTMRVKNEGNFNESILVDVQIPDGYVYNVVPQNLVVNKGQSKYISLWVEAPTDERSFSNYTVRLFSKDGNVALAEMELPGLPVSRIKSSINGKEYSFSSASEYAGTAAFFWEINHGLFPLSNEKRESSDFSVEFTKAGDYVVTLTITISDETMGYLSDTTTVLVSIENQKPDLSMIPDTFSVDVNQTFTLDISAAEDLDGGIADAMFTYNGTTTHGTKFTTRFETGGDHVITITVVDNLGAVAEKELKVTVTAIETPEVQEKNEHVLTHIETLSLLIVGVLLFIFAAMIIPRRKDAMEADTATLTQLEEMRSYRKVKVEELAEIQRIMELEKTHQKCGSCGAYVPKKMNFCNKCGKKMKTQGKTCPKCGEAAPTDVLFCLKCGNEFPKTLIDEKRSSKFVRKACSNCGNVLQQNDMFCDKCGRKVTREEKKEPGDLKKCPTCGKLVGKNIKFCIFCGEKFERGDRMNDEPSTDAIEVVEE